MSAIKNVIIVGGNGNLGALTVKEIQQEPSLNVSILTRSTSSTAPNPSANVKVVTADYSSVDSLAAAFSGYDAVVCTVGMSAISSQIILIDAAIKAGVKRFIPADFGHDILHKNLKLLSIKFDIRKYLEEKNKEIDWTIISNGPFLDWCLNYGAMGINIPARKATIYDKGETRFSTSTLADVARGIVGALTHPEETKNKHLYIHTTVVNQLDLLGLYEKLTGVKWEREDLSTEGWEETVNDDIAKGDWSRGSAILFRAGTDAVFSKVDNELLGVKQVGTEGLEEIVKATL